MFYCKECYSQFSKWHGFCSKCNTWGSIVSIDNNVGFFNNKLHKSRYKSLQVQTIKLQNIEDIDNRLKFSTGIRQIDNTLGGSLMSGQVILLSGYPGVGKSTLVLTICEALDKLNKKILYLCGEESPIQIKSRVNRLNLNLNNFEFIVERDVFTLQNLLLSNRAYDCIVVDSIQTIYHSENTSSIGSVSQIITCTNILVDIAKRYNILTILIGHITKSGDIAGPMILEHLVDTVLLLDGDRNGDIRFLKVLKNRFGPSDEVGVFRISSDGIKENMEYSFIDNNTNSNSIFSFTSEGNLQILVEIEALVTKSYYANPKRTSFGFDLNRLFIILAIIEKILKINTIDKDVFLNVLNGIKINDISLDLAVFIAIYSALKNLKIPEKTVAFGEISLTGKIRKTRYHNKKILESTRMGFENIIEHDKYESIHDVVNFIESHNTN
ncbi:MAG: AAA family ATPase [Candidatus Dojkabacteria bacterium]|nr:AAA family ATPase [Candidatus Dojkabacteria bacterium]